METLNLEMIDVAVYLNPVINQVKLTGINQACNIELINSAGEKLLYQKINNVIVLDLSNYVPGIYLLKIYAQSKLLKVIELFKTYE